MRLRSLLFAPGDSPAKLEKAAGSGADTVILDLEDSVAEDRKAEARRLVAEFLAARTPPRPCLLFVRINALSGPHALHDLAAVARAAPDGIVLPKPEGGACIGRLDNYLAALEAAYGLAEGRIGILPIATETARALFALDTYRGASARLLGLTWGAEDLPVAVGATINRGPGDGYSDLCRLARTLCLAGAAAADLPAIETVYPDFRDIDGLRAYAERGRQDGFTGMMAIHPAQVPVINAAFTPSDAELDEARRIVALFEGNPGAGTVGLDGRMLDRPHLRRARKILAAGGV